MELMDFVRDRLAQFGITGRVGIEGVPGFQCRVSRLADEGGRRQVGFAVTELDRARHGLRRRGDRDHRGFSHAEKLTGVAHRRILFHGGTAHHLAGQFARDLGGHRRGDAAHVLAGVVLDDIGADDGAGELVNHRQHVADAQAAGFAV